MALKVLSLFSGVGAFEMALRNIGIDYELVGFSENEVCNAYIIGRSNIDCKEYVGE